MKLAALFPTLSPFVLATFSFGNIPTFTMDLVPTSSTTVLPGGSVHYQIVGQLSGTANEGLALWGIDLVSSFQVPGGLPRALPGPEMMTFVQPWGVTNPPAPADDNWMNPSGYGGTPIGSDRLVQLGGGQNTIGNTPDNAPFPIGPVVLGIGFDPVVLAVGEIPAPDVPGAYFLYLDDPFANTIDFGETSGPVYNVSAAMGVAGIGRLDFTVVPEPSALTLVGLALLALVRRRGADRWKPCNLE